MRRATLTLAAAGILLALPAPAFGARLIIWTTTSKYVDASKIDFNGPASRPKALRVNVYLPDGYDGKRRFPVLYLLHGHGGAYDDWADPKDGDAIRIAGGLGAVIVMPEGANGWYTNWWNGGRRGDPGWERYYLNELIPLVEQRLRIRPGRRWHTIGGFSMGGEGAAFFAAQRPDYFGAVVLSHGILSIQRPEWPTAMDTQGERHDDVFGDVRQQRFYWSGHNPTALVDNLRHTRLFVAVGDGIPRTLEEASDPVGFLGEAELRQQSGDFVRAAQRAGADITYRPQAGVHEWVYRRRHLSQAIAWGIFRPVVESPAQWTYETVARSGDMWGLRFRFAAPPATLESFSMRAGVLSGQGAGRVTIETPDGCRVELALPFSRKLPSGCTIKLRVRPRVVRAGRLTRFRFRAWVARDGRRVAVRGARIRFAGHRKRTGRRGRASLVLRLRRTGVRRARAARSGLVGASATVRVRRGP